MSQQASAQPQKQQDKATGKTASFFQWKEVAPGIPVFVAMGQGGNTTLIDGKDVRYLVDTKNSPWGKTLRREAESHGQPAAKLVVINTHHHGDHTGGNHAFTKDCEVLAHEKCLPRIPGNMARYVSSIKEAVGNFPKGEGEALEKARADWKQVYDNVTQLEAKKFTPTKTIKETHEITTTGGAKITAHHFGPGHTDNDLVLHIPEHNVLVTGDIIFRKLFPYVDENGGGTIEGWITALKKASELCDKKTHIIPGHGELCGPDGLKDQIDYFEKSRDAVLKALKAGRDRKDILTMKVPFPGYANEDRQEMTMRQLYAELKDKK
jgi:glyoxylase-like metal-dependent hydrolase (beta-lactamase superfamily II)